MSNNRSIKLFIDGTYWWSLMRAMSAIQMTTCIVFFSCLSVCYLFTRLRRSSSIERSSFVQSIVQLNIWENRFFACLLIIEKKRKRSLFNLPTTPPNIISVMCQSHQPFFYVKKFTAIDQDRCFVVFFLKFYLHNNHSLIWTHTENKIRKRSTKNKIDD